MSKLDILRESVCILKFSFDKSGNASQAAENMNSFREPDTILPTTHDINFIDFVPLISMSNNILKRQLSETIIKSWTLSSLSVIILTG